MLRDSKHNAAEIKARGIAAEQFVGKHLETDGFTVLAYNVRSRFGEIDLIAQKGTLIVFIEVKMRQHVYFDLSYLITPSKRQKIIRTAQSFIAQACLGDTMTYRFDVALVTQHAGTMHVHYIAHAFTVEDEL